MSQVGNLIHHGICISPKKDVLFPNRKWSEKVLGYSGAGEQLSRYNTIKVHVHRPPGVTLNETPEEFHISIGLR
jgi:hypothetical protein